MNTSVNNQKKTFNKNNKKINLSSYLSKMVSIKSIKTDSKTHTKRINDYSDKKIENQSKLLAKKELEIKNLKLKCEKLQEENNKYLLQKNLLKTNINNANTSTNFPLKNEIKELWEKFAKIDLLNNFIDFENEPYIIFHIISELFILSDKLIKEKSKSKYKEILKIMGIKDNSIAIRDIEFQFKNFMKEHLNEIFKDLENQSFIYEYKIQIKNIFKDNILTKINNINKEEFLKIFSEILEQNDFNEMIKDINNLILFAQYNEPTLFFNIESNIFNRKIKLIEVKNKKNYIIPNDTNNRNINYILILEPPEIKNGIFFFRNLKQIIMPFNGDYSDDSIIMIKEKEGNNLYNKENINNLNTNAHILINNLAKNNNNKNNFLDININNNEEKKEGKIKINKKFISSLKMLSSSRSKERKNEKKKFEINKNLLNRQCEKYWKTLYSDNYNFYENLEKKRKTSKNNNKIINISNENTKRMKTSIYPNNRRRKNSLRFKEILNYEKNISGFNSEEIVENEFKRNIKEIEKTKEIQNKKELINSFRLLNSFKNMQNNCLTSIKRIHRLEEKRKDFQIKPRKEKKRYITNITFENKNFNSSKFNKNYKKDSPEEISNKISGNRNLRKGTNDIRCKIRNFNINYINIGNSGNILELNNSSIYNSNINHKSKLIKDNTINKNNCLYLPIDDIQKIIETNVNKQRFYTLKNIKKKNNESNNKIFNKTIKDIKSNNRISLNKKLTWIKKENSILLYQRKNNSNNIIRKSLIEKNRINTFLPSSSIKAKKKFINYDNYQKKEQLDYSKKFRTTTINNIRNYSQTNSSLNSAKKKMNKTNQIIDKHKLFKDLRNDIWLDNEEKSPLYIKLLKNKKVNINKTDRKYKLINIKYGNKKMIKDYKSIITLKNTMNSNIGSKCVDKKIINKSTSNILNSKLINRITKN